jgi:hypothetical protein
VLRLRAAVHGPADGGRVTTHKQLLDCLQAKSPGMQRMRLPFSGANVLLYQTQLPVADRAQGEGGN